MRFYALVLMLALGCAATGCNTTGSTSRSSAAGRDTGGGSGVTVFGDIDTGVARTR